MLEKPEIQSFVAAIAAALAVACGGNAGAPGSEEPGDAAEQGAGLANPASTHCLEKGGRLELGEGADGSHGVCVFDDGSRCEEWRFFRGECAPGDCRAPDGRCDADAEAGPASSR